MTTSEYFAQRSTYDIAHYCQIAPAYGCKQCNQIVDLVSDKTCQDCINKTEEK